MNNRSYVSYNSSGTSPPASRFAVSSELKCRHVTFPAPARIISTPPGWYSTYGVTSNTLLWIAIQASSRERCFLNSRSGIVRGLGGRRRAKLRTQSSCERPGGNATFRRPDPLARIWSDWGTRLIARGGAKRHGDLGLSASHAVSQIDECKSSSRCTAVSHGEERLKRSATEMHANFGAPFEHGTLAFRLRSQLAKCSTHLLLQLPVQSIVIGLHDANVTCCLFKSPFQRGKKTFPSPGLHTSFITPRASIYFLGHIT